MEGEEGGGRTRTGRVSKGENLRGECPARKGRLIAGPYVRAAAALKQCRQVYSATCHGYVAC